MPSEPAKDRVVSAAQAFVDKLINETSGEWNVAPAITEWLELQTALKEGGFYDD